MVELLNKDINFNDIKSIIFDFDGTLYNNVPAIRAAVKTVLSQYEINYQVEKAVEEFIDLMEKINAGSLSEIMLNSYKILKEIHFLKDFSYSQKLELMFLVYSKYKQYSRDSKLFQGTEELLRHLAEKADLAIVTSSKKNVIWDLVKKHGIKDYFKLILSADDLKHQKPHPEGIFKAISDLGHAPKNTVYVGDLKTDLMAARAAKINAFAAHNGLISKEKLLEQKPALIYDHITELAKVFSLPEIPIDKESDFEELDITLKESKSLFKEDASFFQSLRDIIPIKIEAEHAKKILMDPLGFISAVIKDIVSSYTSGDVNLSSELEVFTGAEQDLLKSFGLILIHYVNERSNKLIERICQSPLNRPLGYLFGFIKISHENWYPEEFDANFKDVFLRAIQKIVPASVYDNLNGMGLKEFSNSVLEGVETALTDLGLEPMKLKLPFWTSIFRPLSYIFKIFDLIYMEFNKRFIEMTLDVLENDFRHLPAD